MKGNPKHVVPKGSAATYRETTLGIYHISAGSALGEATTAVPLLVGDVLCDPADRSSGFLVMAGFTQNTDTKLPLPSVAAATVTLTYDKDADENSIGKSEKPNDIISFNLPSFSWS